MRSASSPDLGLSATVTAAVAMQGDRHMAGELPIDREHDQHGRTPGLTQATRARHPATSTADTNRMVKPIPLGRAAPNFLCGKSAGR